MPAARDGVPPRNSAAQFESQIPIIPFIRTWPSRRTRCKLQCGGDTKAERRTISPTRVEAINPVLSLLACVLIFLCGTLSFAQQAIPVSIVNLSGLKVPELTIANFVASYNGKAVQVESASPDNNGRRIVLLLDVSDSMLGRTSDADWNFPLDVADHLLAAMPPSTAIGLAAFGTGLEHVMSPTNDRTKLKDEVEVVRKARWSFSKHDQADTSIRDAIIAAAKLFDHPQLGDVLYIITDGIDNTSEANIDDVYQALACRGIRLFAFVVSARTQIRFGSATAEGQRTMRELSEDTGGFSFLRLLPSASPYSSELVDSRGKPTDLAKQFAFQYRAILGVYRLSVDLPEVHRKRQDWQLELSGLDTATKNNLALLYPKKFELCD